MKELRNFIQFGVAERGEPRHASIDTPVMDDGTNQFTFFIMKNQTGTDQIGTSVAARCLCSMTEGAGGSEDLASALSSRSVGRCTETEKLTGSICAPASLRAFLAFRGDPGLWTRLAGGCSPGLRPASFHLQQQAADQGYPGKHRTSSVASDASEDQLCHASGVFSLESPSLGRFQQMVTATRGESEHRERWMLVTCGRKCVATKDIQIWDVVSSTVGVQNAVLRIRTHASSADFVNSASQLLFRRDSVRLSTGLA